MENITINLLEVASELASKKLKDFAEGLTINHYSVWFPKGIYKKDETYTDEAQDLFNDYYEDFSDLLTNFAQNKLKQKKKWHIN